MRKISHWLEPFDSGESVDILRDLALSHALKGGALGKIIAGHIRAERFRELCEFDLDYVALDAKGYTPAQIAECRQALAFFSKLEFLDIGIDKEKVAYEKFVESELACKATNELFRLHSLGKVTFPPRVESALFAASQKIASVLGPVPSFEKLGYRFGKGATTLTKKRMASLREKFRAGVSCSEELVPAASALLGELPTLSLAWADSSVLDSEELWCQVPVVIHDGRLDFVPKSAKTYRSTVTEPVLNGLYQLAVGDHMFERLFRAGLDLRDQTRNQTLARTGSLSGDLATIDLSSASDMIAKELVYHLLPLDWAVFLARGRSGHVTYRGRRLTLEKFSSMGNGYTFPLESLIFWALTRAVCNPDEVVSVYGDDIICPTNRYGALKELLGVCGFVVNDKKSYNAGPFRESCGKDYYRGFDVRPYYQKKLVSGQTLFTLHNHYVRRLEPEMAEKVKTFIHPSLQIYGPDGYGDGHLLGDGPLRKKDSMLRKGFGGSLFDTFTVRPRRDIRPVLSTDFVLPSYSIYRRAQLSFDDLLPAADSVRAAVFRSRFLRKSHGGMSGSEALPDHLIDGESVKGVSFPIDSAPDYKRVSIYTLEA